MSESNIEPLREFDPSLLSRNKNRIFPLAEKFSRGFYETLERPEKQNSRKKVEDSLDLDYNLEF